MSAHKNIDKICAIITVIALVTALFFCNGQMLGVQTTAHAIGYEDRLFDHARVHTIDIVMNDWEGFIKGCENEEYTACNLVIDGEAVKNAGIRAKGNTSLRSVQSMDSSRYSFKIEFDQFENGKTYHGLDKLCLNNIIQDDTYMKDYLAYTLMHDFGVDAPLCSYAYITVNGEDWGLYLAVEAIEDSFLERNYGSNYGDLYKPDTMGFGGGRGNGKDFSMGDFMDQMNAGKTDDRTASQAPGAGGQLPDPGNMPQFDPENMPDREDFDPSRMFGEGGGMPGFGGGKGGFGMGSDDVKLKYTDDDPDSYPSIFNSAKTPVDEADKKRLIRSLRSLLEQSDLAAAVDIEEVMRYFVVHDFLVNGDSYTGQMVHNYYLYEEDGQLSMIPWDYNLAYGSFQGGDAASAVNTPIDTPVSGGMEDRPMIAWIFDNAEYTEQYHQLFREFVESVDFGALVADTAALIDRYVEKDPTKFCTYEKFQTGVEAISKFCTLRAASVRGQLDGTIPSTTEGQKADSSALISAEDLNVSDMGSMGAGFGGFGRNRRSGRSDAAKETDNTAVERTAGTSGFSVQMLSNVRPVSDNAGTEEGGEPQRGKDALPDFGGDMPEGLGPDNMPDFNGQPPQGFDPGSQPVGERPDMSRFAPMNGATQQNNTPAYLLLGVSALVLTLGLVFAWKFRK